MPELISCRVDVFGSGFDAAKFGKAVNLEGASIKHSNKPYPRSSVAAYKLGNVSCWSSPKKYYREFCDDVFSEHLAEEKFVIDVINELLFIREVTAKFWTNTTEIWFVMNYQATEGEQPCGVHFGISFLNKLCELGATLSTDVAVT